MNDKQKKSKLDGPSVPKNYDTVSEEEMIEIYMEAYNVSYEKAKAIVKMEEL